MPGFVDAHTHLPWDGFREDEFNRRLKGETYAAIAAAGGGILATVSATRAASEETLAANVRARLDLMLRHGTTFCEAKTGYGLDLPNEKKQLRALLAGAKGHPVGVAPTALPAHEVPPERRGSRRSQAPLRRGVPRRDPARARGRAERGSSTSSARRASFPSRSRARFSRRGRPSASSRASTRTS